MDNKIELLGVTVALVSMFLVGSKNTKSRRVGFWLGVGTSIYWAFVFAHSGMLYLALYSTVRCLLGIRGIRNNKNTRRTEQC